MALATLASTMFATSAFGQSASSGPQTTFTWGDTSEPSSLNPMKGNLATDYNIWAASYNLPIEFSVKDMSPDYEHSIVTSVDHSSDGLTFTYHVRSGMKWSDGQPFTAEDIAWTLNYYKKNDVSNYAADLAAFKDATATDPTTVVLTASSPTSVYAGETVFMYDYILPEHIWSKYNDDFKAALQDQNVPNVGSGPYVITSYKQGQSVTLERNPNYWGLSVGLTPHYDKLIYVIYNNEDSEAAALQNGEIDYGYFDSANILNTLKGKPNIETRGAFIPNFEEIGINTGSAFETNTTGGFKPHGDGAHALTDVGGPTGDPDGRRQSDDRRQGPARVRHARRSRRSSPRRPRGIGNRRPIKRGSSTSPARTPSSTPPATRWGPTAFGSTRSTTSRSSSGTTRATPTRTRSRPRRS